MKRSDWSMRLVLALLPIIGLMAGLGWIVVDGQPSAAADPLVPTINFTAAPNPAVFGQPVVLTAVVTGDNITGTVTFKDGTSALGSGPVTLDAGGQAALSLATLSVGSHPLTAEYSGDAVYSAITSTAVNQVVGKANTTVLVTSSPSVYGTPATLTATVTASAPGAGTPTGSIIFAIDSNSAAGTVALNNGTASLNISTLGVGSHNVTASYSGDGNFNAGVSPVYAHTVDKIGTTITVASSQSPVDETQAVNFTVAVTPASGTVTPDGTVKISIDSVLTWTLSLTPGSPAKIGIATSPNIASLTAGAHHISAAYSGSATTSASNTASDYIQTINFKPGVATIKLADGIIGVDYIQTLQAANGVAPYSWVLTSGSLPSGLALNANGTLSGQPVQANTYTFGVTVTDSSNFTAARTLIVIIRAPANAYAWGNNQSGQLGDDVNSSIIYSKIPVQVNQVMDSPVMISAGYQHSLAVDASGFVWGWGSNDSGQLGTGNTVSKSVPTYKDKSNRIILDSVIMVSAGFQHSLALQSNGTVWAWGNNDFGQLGDGTTTASSVPVMVNGLPSDIVAVSAGYYHSLALTSTGYVWAWGSNQYGQLGTNSTTSSLVPIQVYYDNSAATRSEYIGDFTAISAGKYHSLALTSSNNVWAWGKNDLGQGGNNDNSNVLIPNQVLAGAADLTGVTQIDAGGDFSLALKSDGTVWAWGSNSAGQLGANLVNAAYYYAYQVKINTSSFLANVTGVSAGDNHALAVRSDGTVWAWGSDAQGKLGNNDTTDSRLAVQVKTGVTTYFSQATAVSAGGLHSLALSSANFLYLSITNTALPAGNIGIAYSQGLTATGGSGSYTWSVYSGSLPNGLSLNSATGVIAGTPATTGTFTFTVRVIDNSNTSLSATASFSVIIAVNTTSINITTTTLANGTINTAYSQNVAASGGSGTYAWYLYAGALPDGLSLDLGAGRIFGTPTKAGEFSFSLKAVDAYDPALSDVANFSITILPDTRNITVATSGVNASAAVVVNYQGYAISNYLLTSLDNQFVLTIGNGARLLDSTSKPVATLSVATLTNPPAPPQGTSLISAYTLGPAGAKFNPGLTAAFKYSKAALPAGVDEGNLYIAVYEGAQWVRMAGTLNPADGTVSTLVDHFSNYALIGTVTPTSTTTTTTAPPTSTATTTPVITTTTTQTSTTAPAKAPAKFNWWLVIGIIGGVLVILIIILVILQRQNKFH